MELTVLRYALAFLLGVVIGGVLQRDGHKRVLDKCSLLLANAVEERLQEVLSAMGRPGKKE